MIIVEGGVAKPEYFCLLNIANPVPLSRAPVLTHSPFAFWDEINSQKSPRRDDLRKQQARAQASQRGRGNSIARNRLNSAAKVSSSASNRPSDEKWGRFFG